MEENRYRDPELVQSEQHTLAPYMGMPLLNVRMMRYIPHERGMLWKMGMGLFTLILLLIAVFTQAWIMGVTIIVFVWVYLRTHGNEFDPLHAELIFTDMGVFYQGEYYPYAEIETYFFVLDPDVTSFHFRLKGSGGQKIVTYLERQEDMIPVKEVLNGKVEEQAVPEKDTMHRLFRMLKL